MNRTLATAIAAAGLFLFAEMSHAALAPYTQDFETLVQADPAALDNDGWDVFGNVFDPTGTIYLYGYGPFPAPNPGGGFSAIANGEGGIPQGAQQLSVYNDYNNLDHAVGNRIESIVYREQIISAADALTYWTFQFDAKIGNLESPSTAVAFIKTLDPNNGFITTNNISVDMTAIPTSWGTYSVPIVIAPSLVGQLLQIGFASTTTLYKGSGIFYDNIFFFTSGSVGVDGPRASSRLQLSSGAPNPFSGSTRIEYALTTPEKVDLSVFDVTGRHVATVFSGTAAAGRHSASWDGRTASGTLAPTGVYRCVLKSATGHETRNLVLSR